MWGLLETCFGPHEHLKGSPCTSPSLKLHEDEGWFGGTLAEHQECSEANVPTTLLLWRKWWSYWNINRASKLFWSPGVGGKGVPWSRQRRRAKLDLELRMAKEEAKRFKNSSKWSWVVMSPRSKKKQSSSMGFSTSQRLRCGYSSVPFKQNNIRNLMTGWKRYLLHWNFLT